MNPEACVIRLEDGKSQTWGTGFVVGPSLAVTCAHVVEACGAGLGLLLGGVALLLQRWLSQLSS